jgi:hypothetical protein
MHFITSIVNVKPYCITVIFDGNEQRKINFESLLPDFPVLRKPEVFISATLDDYPTLKWDGLAKIKELDGTIVPAPLDFSPDTLYLLSEISK